MFFSKTDYVRFNFLAVLNFILLNHFQKQILCSGNLFNFVIVSWTHFFDLNMFHI